MDLPQPPGLAPASSDLGLLQRGRGNGWRRAAESVRHGRDHLLACVADDPRWDRQVEHRATYYATLAIRLSLPATEVCVLVDGTEDGWLAESVLEAMAEHGDTDAARLHADVAEPEDHRMTFRRPVAALCDLIRPPRSMSCWPARSRRSASGSSTG
ncbi:hypothetical protein [Antribacter gilvus]|uniref:hypothetical protein n=1 Tax=Antribacter gilvus TaxID=2304675 RepID=UPI000F78AE3C|nr:hypothetical protein [Antribacter gilvus]